MLEIEKETISDLTPNEIDNVAAGLNAIPTTSTTATTSTTTTTTTASPATVTTITVTTTSITFTADQKVDQ